MPEAHDDDEHHHAPPAAPRAGDALTHPTPSATPTDAGGHDHDEEHGPVFRSIPLVDPRVVETVANALRATASADPRLAQTSTSALDDLLRRQRRLEWLGGVVRRMLLGDAESADQFDDWLADCLTARSARNGADRCGEARDSVAATRHEDPLKEVERLTGPATPYGLAPQIDLYFGIAWRCGTDRARLAEAVDGAHAEILACVLPLFRMLGVVLQGAGSLDDPGGMLQSLRAVGTSRALASRSGSTAGLATRLLADYRAMSDAIAAYWRGRNVVTRWQEETAALSLNESIASVSPATTSPGQRVRIFAQAGAPFPAKPPHDVRVLFEPWGLTATIESWSAGEVAVTVPEWAASGNVFFGREPERAQRAAVGASAAALRTLCGRWWPELSAHHYLESGVPRRAWSAPDERNRVTVLRKPRVDSLLVFDELGVVDEKRPVAADARLRIQWRVAHDGITPPRIAIHAGPAPIADDLPASGSLTTAATVHGDITITASNQVGSSRGGVTIFRAAPSLVIAPSPVRVAEHGRSFVAVRLPRPAARDVTVELSTSDVSRVALGIGGTAVTERVVIPAGATEGIVWVRALAHAPAGEVAAVLHATADGYSERDADVWVEPAAGVWASTGFELDVVAVHAAVMPTGRVAFFSFDEARPWRIEDGKLQEWDPSRDHPEPLLRLQRNPFCSGHAFDWMGRLVIAGGQDLGQKHEGDLAPWTIIASRFGLGIGADHDVHTYWSATGNYARRPDMAAARWYPTCATLPTGKVLIVGGFAVHNYFIFNSHFELYDSSTDSISHPEWFRPVELFPFLQVLPDGTPEGLVFVHQKNETRFWKPDFSTSREGVWLRWPEGGWLGGETLVLRTESPYARTYPKQSGHALLPIRGDGTGPLRILVAGGQGGPPVWGSREGIDLGSLQAADTAELFEFDRAVPERSRWRTTGSLSGPRFMSDAVLLPDGTVFLCNGTSRGSADESFDAVMTPELFDPATERWRPMATQPTPRHYHAVALLLPDGRVVVGGNTQVFNPDRPVDDRSIDVFSPPYLFRGPRPVITRAPQHVEYGTDFPLDVAPDVPVHAVALLRNGSVTHTVNMDQRMVTLGFERSATGRLRVHAPIDGTVAPPGPYMLFVLSADGVPSHAAMVVVGWQPDGWMG